MNKNEVTLKILLNKKLTIPEYQRPYEWGKSNVFILLEDIIENYKEDSEINLGSIILFKNNEKFEIVDGQQRIITLSLLLNVLNPNIDITFFNEEMLCVSSTEIKIIKNYHSIKELIHRLEEKDNLNIKKFYKYLEHNVKFYLLEVNKIEESFQLFDGRNSKYKDLSPVDLLKAYHLGEISQKNIKIKVLNNWQRNMEEKFDIDNYLNKNEYLFNCMLFNIYNWSLNKSIRPFSKNDIFLYKGYNETDTYEYVKYYKSCKNNSFQINKPFKAGEGFFLMVEHYIKMLDDIIVKNNLLDKINCTDNYHFRYIYFLYYGSLLLFYDKFGKNISDFNRETIVDFICKWSLTHRINNQLVSLDTINHYVLSSDYNFFFECNNALKVEELFKLETNSIENEPSDSEKLGELRSKLWKKLNYAMD